MHICDVPQIARNWLWLVYTGVSMRDYCYTLPTSYIVCPVKLVCLFLLRILYEHACFIMCVYVYMNMKMYIIELKSKVLQGCKLDYMRITTWFHDKVCLPLLEHNKCKGLSNRSHCGSCLIL